MKGTSNTKYSMQMLGVTSSTDERSYIAMEWSDLQIKCIEKRENEKADEESVIRQCVKIPCKFCGKLHNFWDACACVRVYVGHFINGCRIQMGGLIS